MKNNYAKVSFLKSFRKENILQECISLQLNQNRRQIFAHQNFVGKSTCKQRGFFNHQNYVGKSTWKQHRFFDQQNYTEKNTWKRRGFFDQQNYIEKVRGNDLEICLNLVFNIST